VSTVWARRWSRYSPGRQSHGVRVRPEHPRGGGSGLKPYVLCIGNVSRGSFHPERLQGKCKKINHMGRKQTRGDWRVADRNLRSRRAYGRRWFGKGNNSRLPPPRPSLPGALVTGEAIHGAIGEGREERRRGLPGRSPPPLPLGGGVSIAPSFTYGRAMEGGGEAGTGKWAAGWIQAIYWVVPPPRTLPREMSCGPP